MFSHKLHHLFSSHTNLDTACLRLHYLNVFFYLENPQGLTFVAPPSPNTFILHPECYCHWNSDHKEFVAVFPVLRTELREAFLLQLRIIIPKLVFVCIKSQELSHYLHQNRGQRHTLDTELFIVIFSYTEASHDARGNNMNLNPDLL